MHYNINELKRFASQLPAKSNGSLSSFARYISYILYEMVPIYIQIYSHTYTVCAEYTGRYQWFDNISDFVSIYYVYMCIYTNSPIYNIYIYQLIQHICIAPVNGTARMSK